MSYEIIYYETADGRFPFLEWFKELKDQRAAARVDQRIDRLSLGLFGDVKPVGDGVHELRVDVGKGYRIYFANSGSEIILLLEGGNKGTQAADIRKAKEYWNDYKKR